MTIVILLQATTIEQDDRFLDNKIVIAVFRLPRKRPDICAHKQDLRLQTACWISKTIINCETG